MFTTRASLALVGIQEPYIKFADLTAQQKDQLTAIFDRFSVEYCSVSTTSYKLLNKCFFEIDVKKILGLTNSNLDIREILKDTFFGPYSTRLDQLSLLAQKSANVLAMINKLEDQKEFETKLLISQQPGMFNVVFGQNQALSEKEIFDTIFANLRVIQSDFVDQYQSGQINHQEIFKRIKDALKVLDSTNSDSDVTFEINLKKFIDKAVVLYPAQSQTCSDWEKFIKERYEAYKPKKQPISTTLLMEPRVKTRHVGISDGLEPKLQSTAKRRKKEIIVWEEEEVLDQSNFNHSQQKKGTIDNLLEAVQIVEEDSDGELHPVVKASAKSNELPPELRFAMTNPHLKK